MKNQQEAFKSIFRGFMKYIFFLIPASARLVVLSIKWEGVKGRHKHTRRPFEKPRAGQDRRYREQRSESWFFQAGRERAGFQNSCHLTYMSQQLLLNAYQVPKLLHAFLPPSLYLELLIPSHASRGASGWVLQPQGNPLTLWTAESVSASRWYTDCGQLTRNLAQADNSTTSIKLWNDWAFIWPSVTQKSNAWLITWV